LPVSGRKIKITRNKLVSILIPAYNAEKYIAEAIDSVLSQDYQNKEIIVINDGSTDCTLKILEQYKGVIKVISKKNEGVAAARNTGLAAANGDYIAWLDADDYYCAGKIPAQVKYLDEHPDAKIVFTKYENFFEGEPSADVLIRIKLEKNNRYCQPTSMFRRELTAKVGNHDISYTIGEDIDWIFRAKIMYNVNLDHYIDIPYYRRRFHTNNSILNIQLDKNYNNRIMMKYLKQKREIGK
jgi:glycosyltransferase involved in cell wall biosynthesis